MSGQPAIAEAVRLQYEAYPYPPFPITYVPKGFSVLSSYTLAEYARSRHYRDTRGKQILIAGCGTGHEIHLTALSNPGVDAIIGVDFCQASINLARERIKQHGLVQCQAVAGDLLNKDSLPVGPFDMVLASGVLHHTADPGMALSNLVSRLAPDGVMGIMLYNQPGRWMNYRLRQALKEMGIQNYSLKEAVAFIRTLLSGAHTDSLLGAYARAHKAYFQEDANIIDTLLHPQDIPFSIAEIPSFLAAAGLTFLDVVPDGIAWRPEQVITRANQDFYKIFDSMERLEQLKILELLHPFGQTENVFWCCHQDHYQPQAFPEFSETKWHLNPLFVQHAHVVELDQTVQNCVGSPELLKLPKVSIEWRLFPTASKRTVFSRLQIKHLLIPLFSQPCSGQELLISTNPSQHSYIENVLWGWEKDRVVLLE